MIYCYHARGLPDGFCTAGCILSALVLCQVLEFYDVQSNMLLQHLELGCLVEIIDHTDIKEH